MIQVFGLVGRSPTLSLARKCHDIILGSDIGWGINSQIGGLSVMLPVAGTEDDPDRGHSGGAASCVRPHSEEGGERRAGPGIVLLEGPEGVRRHSDRRGPRRPSPLRGGVRAACWLQSWGPPIPSRELVRRNYRRVPLQQSRWPRGAPWQRRGCEPGRDTRGPEAPGRCDRTGGQWHLRI